MPPIRRTCSSCERRSPRSKRLALGHLAGQPLGLLHLDVALHTFHQRHHVAHAQDALRHAFRIEELQRFGLLAHAKEDDGLAR